MLVQSSVIFIWYCAFGIKISINFQANTFQKLSLILLIFSKDQIMLRIERSPQTTAHRQ